MSNTFGIDLGTCNVKVFCKATGKVLNEKNTIAIVNKNQMYAYGDQAYAMYEKAPENINVTFPVINGVIADYANMQTMIFEFLEKYSKGKVRGAEFVVAVPTDITEVEKKAFFDIFAKSKVKPKGVLLCEKPLADAVGLGIDVNEPTGVMVVDIGADTTEISVMSLGGLVLSDLLHFGGNRIDESIISHLKRTYSLVIGQKTAMTLKEKLGYGVPGAEDSMVIVGRDLVSGLPVEQFACYGDYQRDPRARIITSAYLSIVKESDVSVEAGDDAADAAWFEIEMEPETAYEEDGWEKTEYHLTIQNQDQKRNAVILKKERTGLVREKYYVVKEGGGIAVDHAAILAQAYELLKGRL